MQDVSTVHQKCERIVFQSEVLLFQHAPQGAALNLKR